MTLSITQRIQLLAVLGDQRGSVSRTREILGIMKSLDLSDAEKRSVNYVQHVNGSVAWSEPEPITDTFDLTTRERLVLREAIDSSTFRPADMVWLEGVLEQL